jgi:sulfane dehydrogenase subunit SoxC
MGFGKPIPEDDYGVPSKFESHVRRRRTDVLKNRQNFSD